MNIIAHQSIKLRDALHELMQHKEILDRISDWEETVVEETAQEINSLLMRRYLQEEDGRPIGDWLIEQLNLKASFLISDHEVSGLMMQAHPFVCYSNRRIVRALEPLLAQHGVKFDEDAVYILPITDSAAQG